MAKLILTGRILGILWTTASWSSTEESIQVTNQNYEIVKEIQSFLAKLGFEYTIYQGLKKLISLGGSREIHS